MKLLLIECTEKCPKHILKLQNMAQVNMLATEVIHLSL